MAYISAFSTTDISSATSLPVNNNHKPVPRLEIYDTKLVKRSLGGLNSAKKRSRTAKAHYL